MMRSDPELPGAGPRETKEAEGKSDLKVVLQFFIVPLSLVVVLVSLFFGLQIMRRHRPDTASTLKSLESYEGFLARYVGDVKRWQSGYDLSLLVRGDGPTEVRRILPQLAAAFRDAGVRRDLQLRRYLALVLGHSGDAAAVAPLREGLKDGDAQTRLFSCWSLMEIGDVMALPDLRAAAADADSGVRKAAVFALGRLADRDAAGVLRGALGDPVPDVRWNAALALARISDPAGVPVLIGLLKESASATPGRDEADNRERALNAVRGLALLKDPQARAPLAQAAATASDGQVRTAARLALDSYDAPSAGATP